MPDSDRPVSYQLVFTRQARRDAKTLKHSTLLPKAKIILEELARDPFHSPQPYEALVGDLSGAYSRRLNAQHRIVYQVLSETHVVKVLRLWTHYD